MKKAKYTPAHIANYFLWKAKKENIELTAMKLIKLVYVAYGWYLAFKDEKLFDERIEAWRYGPVIPSLYHEFKRFRNDPIEKLVYSKEINIESGELEDIPVIDIADE